MTQAVHMALAAWYPKLARDPGIYAVVIKSAVDTIVSGGGDAREIPSLASDDIASARAALASGLRLCWIHECFSKPTVSLIDGLVMGSGVGITLYGTHRVAGAGYRLRMAETAIGRVPGSGVSHALARMPDAIGFYLGLTGVDVGPADALALGLVTHCIPGSEYPAIERGLAEADPVDPILDQLHRPPGEGPLVAMAPRIGRYFSAPTIADIFAGLASSAVEDRDWADETLARLRARSPLALSLAFRAIRNAEQLDIREALMQDYRLAWRLLADPEFIEGARAVVVEKRRPRWRHPTIGDVPAQLVDAFFAPLGADELALPMRAQMQAVRP